MIIAQLSNEQNVEALFRTAGFDVFRIWELQNRYMGTSDPEWSAKRPSWLVKTEYGLIDIGPRKRVVEIDWREIDFRGKVTREENVTSENSYVHAWTVEKMICYLFELRKQLCIKQEDE